MSNGAVLTYVTAGIVVLKPSRVRCLNETGSCWSRTLLGDSGSRFNLRDRQNQLRILRELRDQLLNVCVADVDPTSIDIG